MVEDSGCPVGDSALVERRNKLDGELDELAYAIFAEFVAHRRLRGPPCGCTFAKLQLAGRRQTNLAGTLIVSLHVADNEAAPLEDRYEVSFTVISIEFTSDMLRERIREFTLP
jgi:hypothetical protein